MSRSNSLLLALAMWSGCGSSVPQCPGVVGDWTDKEGEVQITFLSDGTYAKTTNGGNTDSGTWSLDGTVLSINDSDCPSNTASYDVFYTADCSRMEFELTNGGGCGVTPLNGLQLSGGTVPFDLSVVPDLATPPPKPGIACTAGSTSCSCTQSSTANAVKCSNTTQTNSICCADSGFPSSGNCKCTTLGCSTIDSTHCSCGTFLTPSAQTSCSNGASVCCVFTTNGTCICDTSITDCSQRSSAWTDVGTSCDNTTVGCLSTQTQVYFCR